MTALASYIAAVFREPRDDSWAVAIAAPTPAETAPVLDLDPVCPVCSEHVRMGETQVRLTTATGAIHWRCLEIEE
jgi:hypothetical protein